MNILLFGASGRLGSAFRRVLESETFITPSHAEVDLKNEASVAEYLETVDPDIIINTTAYNKCDAAEGEGREEAIELNVHVPERLARFAAIKKIPFIHFSTDYVFDGEKAGGYTEDEEANPVNVYGRSKRDGEIAVLNAYPEATIIRVSRLFGPRADSVNAKPDFIEIVKEYDTKQSSVMFFDKEFGSPTYVDDLVRHIQTHLLPKPPAGIFHMANQGGCTWYRWAQEIVDQLNLPLIIERRTTEAVRAAQIPQYTMLLSTKVPPMRPWQEALRDYLDGLSKEE